MLSSVLRMIPPAIAAVLLLVAVIVIYIRSKYVTRSEFYKMFRRIKPLTVWTIVFTLILTGVFAICNHVKAKQHMMAVVSLNYSEASQAQNTNGTRFNMTEIICDEVIERAIRLGAFEDVTVEQLKECLSVYPYVQGDVNDEANYHISTEFIVEYIASNETEHLDSENVIALVACAYKEYYIEKYTDNFSLTGHAEKPDYTKMEYMDTVAYLNKATTHVLNYLYGMAEKAPSFVTSSKTSFSSIAGKVYQFRQTQIEGNLRSLILQYGIVRDKGEYLDRLTYQNIKTEFDKQKHIASFDVCNATIDMYSVEMTRVVLVPTKDANGKYYMGRTNVGLDELSVMATSFSDMIAENEKELMNSNLIMQKMQEADPESAYPALADALIQSIDQTLDDLTLEAVTAGREYLDHQMNQCIAVSTMNAPLFDELKMIAVFAVFAYITAIAYELSKKFPKA
jgi:hypothetical protein